MRLLDRDCGAAWGGFFRDHCDALFQMALLLSADPDTAEGTLATTLQDIDISVPPKTDDLGILQKTIVIKIVHDAGSVSSASISNAGSMVQRGLRPILQLEKFPRVCFVLRFLLGYGMSSCAQMMGVEEAGAKALLHLGLVQFHRAVMGGTPERLTHLPRERSGNSLGPSGINHAGFGESNANVECSVSSSQCVAEDSSAHFHARFDANGWRKNGKDALSQRVRSDRHPDPERKGLL